MQSLKTIRHPKIVTLVIVTVFCAVANAFVALSNTTSVTFFTVLFLLTTIVVCQTLMCFDYLKLKRRHHKFHQVSRQQARIKAQRGREEALALKILNHINSTAERTADHAHVWQKPLQGFSGDLALAYESKHGHKYTLLADLTGHGIAAAISAAPVASIFRATVRNCLSVEDIATELNNRLQELLPSGFFCCAAIILDNNGTVTACNAGLPDIIITNDDGDIINTIASTQLPLGIEYITAEDVEVFTNAFQQRHQLYAFTDGLIETRGANDEVFDFEKLTTLVSSRNDGTGRLDEITECFESFSKDSQINDDISIVEVIIR